ncbi:MAG: DMT family transporter [Ilumatobacteraceae bacterium]
MHHRGRYSSIIDDIRFSSPRQGAHASSLSLIAAAACWGTAAVISKRAVDEIEPLTLLPIELAVSVGVLSVAARAHRERFSNTVQMRRLAALGVLNPGLAYALSLAGLVRITASMSVLLWAIEPVLILGLAYLIIGERISGLLGFCAAVALTGVVLVVLHGNSHGSTTGVLLTIAGVAACALYTVLSSRYLVDAATVMVVLVQQITALAFALVLLAGSFLLGHPHSVASVSLTGWISALAAGVLYYGVAFWFYLAGLRRVSAGYAGMFINLVPVFGVAAGGVFLGERLTGRQWGGAGLILAAVAAVIALQARASPEVASVDHSS